MPSCSDCKKWVYDTKTWKRKINLGKETPRPAGAPTPCHECPKSGVPNTPRPDNDITAKSRAAYWLYLEIKAGVPMPDDAIVRRNCTIIRWLEDRSHAKDMGWGQTLASLLTIKTASQKR